MDLIIGSVNDQIDSDIVACEVRFLQLSMIFYRTVLMLSDALCVYTSTRPTQNRPHLHFFLQSSAREMINLLASARNETLLYNSTRIRRKVHVKSEKKKKEEEQCKYVVILTFPCSRCI